MSAAKAKGTRWESAIVGYLIECGFPAVERRALNGAKDKGDVAGLPVVVEAKNHKTPSLGSWVDEADVEARNAGVPVGVVWHHRRGKASPADGFVTMSGSAFVALLQALRHIVGGAVPAEDEPLNDQDGSTR